MGSRCWELVHTSHLASEASEEGSEAARTVVSVDRGAHAAGTVAAATAAGAGAVGGSAAVADPHLVSCRLGWCGCESWQLNLERSGWESFQNRVAGLGVVMLGGEERILWKGSAIK